MKGACRAKSTKIPHWIDAVPSVGTSLSHLHLQGLKARHKVPGSTTELP